MSMVCVSLAKKEGSILSVTPVVLRWWATCITCVPTFTYSHCETTYSAHYLLSRRKSLMICARAYRIVAQCMFDEWSLFFFLLLGTMWWNFLWCGRGIFFTLNTLGFVQMTSYIFSYYQLIFTVRLEYVRVHVFDSFWNPRRYYFSWSSWTRQNLPLHVPVTATKNIPITNVIACTIKSVPHPSVRAVWHSPLLHLRGDNCVS